MGYTENEFARLPGDLQRKDPDMVRVVRCKDCKRCFKRTTKRYKQPMWICMRHELGHDKFCVRPDDFCSYGEMDQTDAKQ